MRKTLLLVLILLAANAFAAGDAAITSLTSNSSSVQSGDDLTLTVRIRNNGPDATNEINLNVNNSYEVRMNVLSFVAPPGWQCSSTFLNCWTNSMAAGTEVTLIYRTLAPPTVRPAAFVVSAFLGTSGDGNLGNNRADLPIALVASSRSSDLSLSVSAPPNPIPQSTPVTLAYDVRNDGPQDLSDVRVAVYIPLPNLTREYEGAGWTCTSSDAFGATCRRDFLAAHANAPLAVRFMTPAVNQQVDTQATVFALQAHLDENLSNDRVFRSLSIGSTTDWSRILVPFAEPETPGANGSLWKTEIRGVIESSVLPVMDPAGCGPIEDPCSSPPLNTLFDAFDEDLVLRGTSPHFIYVNRADASKVKLATRVYDASKSGTTAGAFVPMARDDDFSAAGFSLIAIPVAPQFRSTLRLYDATGIDGREVEVALYADAASEPFLRRTVTLETLDEQYQVTTALLPFYPATAQLDLSSLIPAGTTRVRVTVRPPVPSDPPIAPAMQLWGFASITNNETSHVTVVTP